MQQLRVADPVVALAEGVVELRRCDQALGEGGGHRVHQRLVALAVDHPVGTVAVGGLLHRLEHQLGEGAAHALCPLLHPTQDRAGVLQLAGELLARGHRPGVAGHGVGHADLLHAVLQLGLGVLDVEQVAVDLHLAGALGQVPHGLDLLVQATQLVHGQRIERLGQVECALHGGLQCREHGGVVLLDQGQVLERGLAGLRCHPVGGQHGACCVDHVGVAPLLDHLLVVVLDDALEEGEVLAHLGLGVDRGLGGGVVQHLVLLGLDRLLGLTLGGGLGPALARAALGGGVLPGLRLQVFERGAGDHIRGELLGRLDQGVDRDPAALRVHLPGVRARVQHLGLGAQLGGK